MLNWAPHWLLPPLSCCSRSEWQPGGTSSPSWRLSEPSLAASGRRLMWPTCINHNFSSSHITHSKRRKVKRIVIGKMVSHQHAFTSMRQCFKNLNKISPLSYSGFSIQCAFYTQSTSQFRWAEFQVLKGMGGYDIGHPRSGSFHQLRSKLSDQLHHLF